jgi:Arc/MetJ-type ribon-helix-helix transcriptional regulator
MAPLTSPIAEEVRAPDVASLVIRRRRRYDSGMTKVAKITISLPPEQVEQARAAVSRGEAASVSSYISAALAAVAPPEPDEQDTLADFVADLKAENGTPSPEAYAWARKALSLSEPE